MRYDTFGNYHVDPTAAKLHNFNTTVPGVLGYQSQRADGPPGYTQNIDTPGYAHAADIDLNDQGGLDSPYHRR